MSGERPPRAPRSNLREGLYGARRIDAFAITPAAKEGEKDWWTRIGAAFANRDGSISISLRSLPCSAGGEARIVLREHTERETEGAE